MFSWGNTWQPGLANTWQGTFPVNNTAEDGYPGTAPVGHFQAKGYGQLDPRLEDPAASSAPREPGLAKHVIRGGPFLCAPSYCSRYRPAAREAESRGSGTSHIGFRLVSSPTTTHG